MTYSELLRSVKFDDIVPFISKYHGHEDCMAWYKIHYDILCRMTPHRDTDIDEDGKDMTTATISCYVHEEDEKDIGHGKLDAPSLEGDLWEVALAKELVIEPDVKASLGEMAACCLWHTSYFGFTDSHRESLISNIGEFIEELHRGKSVIAPPSVRELCQKLLWGKHCHNISYQTYINDAPRRGEYFKELIVKYKAFTCAWLPCAIVCLSSSSDYPVTMEEMELVKLATQGCEDVQFCVKVDDNLGQELMISVAFYEN